MFPGRGHPNGFYHPCPQDIEPPAYPPDFHRGVEDRGWAPQDHQQAANWDPRHGRCEEGFRDLWHSPFSRDIEPYPADFYGGDEGRCWAPQDHQQPARWDNQRGRHEEGFGDGWHLAMPPNQHCPEPISREKHSNSWDWQASAGEQGYFPKKYRGRGWKHRRGLFRGGYRGKFAPHYHRFQPGSCKEKFKSSKLSTSRSPRSHSLVQLEASQKATEPPSQTDSALATESPACPETTEDLPAMRTEEVEPVQLGASLEAADNHSQACCAPVSDSVLAETPEELCLPEEEIKLVQLEASHATAEPPATPETTEDLHPIRTEETELLQLEDHLKAPDLLSQAVSALATLPPVLSEIAEELPPVGKEEIELEQLDAPQEDAGYPHQAYSAAATSLETTEDLRSAAILARKEEIELSYQQYSLAFAVLAALLLQKEPSMEAAMGSALRANLRQVGGHCLQELEHFISSYDAGSASS
ncbi:periphilin-1-like isoform X2 [Emydura macquarii macquarii]|uniref:periphilin-1-like isoform X2 n=1 Tax=Emydura macquarii macquarii TaxID=1129001 RepID=UPI00352AFB7B